MTRRSRLGLLVAVVVLEIALVFVTGVPVRWTTGTVLAEACKPLADAYACQVGLVADATRVTARSDRAIAAGRRVRLLGWLDPASGMVTYTVH